MSSTFGLHASSFVFASLDGIRELIVDSIGACSFEDLEEGLSSDDILDEMKESASFTSILRLRLVDAIENTEYFASNPVLVPNLKRLILKDAGA